MAVITGTTPPVAPIGATTLIGPIAAARWNVSSASPLAMPAAMPKAALRTSGGPVPSYA